jgi:hypothetical protein
MGFVNGVLEGCCIKLVIEFMTKYILMTVIKNVVP